MSSKNPQRIMYVNFAPYENAGGILQYLLDHFPTVIVYTFDFHHLNTSRPLSRLSVYKNKERVYETRLYQTPTPKTFAFILLPIRSVVIFLQLLFHCFRLSKKYGKPDVYFTVNAFTAWCGNVMRDLGLVGKTIFWVWDYYPPVHADPVVAFMRWLYWHFDKPATQYSNHLAFLNRRLYDLRIDLGILDDSSNFPIVPIGTNPHPIKHRSIHTPIRLVFLGVLRKIQGIDLIIDAIPELMKEHHSFEIHVIGSGPDEETMKKRCIGSPIPVIFHGYVTQDRDVDTLLKHCDIGLAPYVPDKSNVMYYSDPSKIKRYLNVGLPVLMTDVFDFSKDLKESHAGFIISYDAKNLAKGVNEILQHYQTYSKNASDIAKTISYTKIYRKLFDF